MAANFYKKLYEKQEIKKKESEEEEMIEREEEEEVPKILESEVRWAISKLKRKKAAGPDKIKNESLKTFSGILTKPISTIFNLILESEEIPQQW